METSLSSVNVQDDYRKYLKHSLKFLLIIWIRPLVDLFLRFPRELNRKHTVKLAEFDLGIIEICQGITNNMFGANLPASLLREINTVVADRKFISYPIDMTALVEPRLCENKQDVSNQLAEDVKDFFEHIKKSVYFASSVEKFYQQEVDAIKNKFVDEEEKRRGWQYLAFEAVDENNAYIPDLNQLQNVIFRLNLKMLFVIYVLIAFIRLRFFV
jgi:hypothetical protein